MMAVNGNAPAFNELYTIHTISLFFSFRWNCPLFVQVDERCARYEVRESNPICLVNSNAFIWIELGKKSDNKKQVPLLKCVC